MIRLFKHYIPHAVMLLACVDFVLLMLAGEIAWHLRVNQIDSSTGPVWDRVFPILTFAFACGAALVAVGGYSPESLRSVRYATARILVAISLGVIFLSVLDLAVEGDIIWRSILLYAMGLTVIFLVANRALLGPLLGTSTFQRKVLILGAGRRAQRLYELSLRKQSSFVITAFVKMGEGPSQIVDAMPRSSIADLGGYVERRGAREVVLAMEERRNALPLKDLLRVKTKGIHVCEFSSFLERETGRVDLDTLNPSWLIFSDGFSSGRAISSVFKRVFDVTVSLLIMAFTWPLVLLFALLIRIESAGPVIYRQERVGLFGTTFDVLKLRSMTNEAEKEGAQFAQENDPRITRIGKFIRLVRIDELPQLWNVLKGDMSFVGPRPERPQFVSSLGKELPYYEERHMVKPGITGWAQINFPYGASFDDSRQKLEYDLYYAKNYSIFLDVVILLQTLRVILWPEGAR